MGGSSWGSIVILLGVLFCAQVYCAAEGDKSVRALKSRLRTSSSWRLVVSFAQSQTSHGRVIHAVTDYRNEIQAAWEKTRSDASLADVEISYVEARETPVTDSLSYPLSLLNKFCMDIENGKTILSIVVGGGPAARFLITAASSLNLPTLWLPYTYRDFIQQVCIIYSGLMFASSIFVNFPDCFFHLGKTSSFRKSLGIKCGRSRSRCSCPDAQSQLARVHSSH